MFQYDEYICPPQMCKFSTFCVWSFFLYLLSACSTVHNVKDIEVPSEMEPWTGKSDMLFMTESKSGCQEAKTKLETIKKYIISLNKNGEYSPLSFQLEDCDWSKPIRQEENFSNQFQEILSAIFNSSSETRKKILLFIHGGLNTFDDRTRRAIQHSYLISQYALENGEKYYPLFINWPSGLFDTYGNQIFNIRQGDEEDRAPYTFPLYFLSDLGQSVSRLPATWEKSLSREVGSKLFGEIVETCESKHKSPDTVVCRNPTQRSFFVKAGRVARFIPTYPFRLFFSLPVDSFGKTAWVNMLRRTQTILRKPQELQYGKLPLTIQDSFNGTGDLAVFLQMLSNKLTRNRGYSLSIIGHSMGTIISNEIIRSFPRLPYENIVYMAAACSIRDFELSVIPVLRENGRNIKFFNLSLDPHAEAREYTVGGIGPTGSLLEWIDEFYTDPPTILDRTLGKWRNIVVTKNMFPKTALEKMTFKVFRWEDGKDPTGHGDFTEYNFCYWDPKFWKDSESHKKCKYNEHYDPNS